MNPQDALRQYATAAVEGRVESATPHGLVAMLMDGALEKIAIARVHMGNGQIAEKGEHISWAITIIAGLRASLDREQGGEIAANLDALYDYMERRLLEANLRNDATMLDEVSGLLRQIKFGWDAIPEELRRAGGPTP
ncbi:MAG: flagellar export chaperone FliS [Thiohalomonadaceae bacterium]